MSNQAIMKPGSKRAVRIWKPEAQTYPITPVPKPVRIKSKALTSSAKGRECTLRWLTCNHDPETTVFAHYRGIWSLGQGTKPPDFCGAFACSDCHKEQERGNIPHSTMLRAMIASQYLMARDGLLTVKGWKP